MDNHSWYITISWGWGDKNSTTFEYWMKIIKNDKKDFRILNLSKNAKNFEQIVGFSDEHFLQGVVLNLNINFCLDIVLILIKVSYLKRESVKFWKHWKLKTSKIKN